MARSRSRTLSRKKVTGAASDSVPDAVGVGVGSEVSSNDSIGAIARDIESNLRAGAALVNCTIVDGELLENVGEIEIDPKDDSLFEEEMTEPVDDETGGDVEGGTTVTSAEGKDTTIGSDSAVGTDDRTDSSFQSSGSDNSPPVGDDSVSSSDAGGSVVVEPSLHECVTLISDSVHLQGPVINGVVDSQVVST